MKSFAQEQAARLSCTVGPLLTASIGATAATTDVTLVANAAAGSYVVIEQLELTLAAAGTVAVYDNTNAGARMTGDHVRASGELFLRLTNLVSPVAAHPVVLGRTNIAVGGHVVYRILSPGA